jgi:HlyD family secretion protein
VSDRPRARTLWLLLLAAGAIAAVVVARRSAHRQAAALDIPVEAAARRDIAVTIEATGTVEPIDLVEIKSKASGQIIRMPVEVGSHVKAGDLLAQIDINIVANQYAQSLASQRAAQAKVDISGAQLKRSDELFAAQVITADEHESAVLDFASAQAALVTARTNLDNARQAREDATVRAPIAGTVLQQMVSAGQVISSATSSASGGTALLNMADLSRIRLRALVNETDIGNVRPGQAATVTVDAFPQRPFQAQVEKIEPQAVVQQSVTLFPVLISISNEGGLLLPGMNGEVSMEVDQRNGVLAIPLDAVRSVRELPAVALALGMNADSLRAQIQRQQEARALARAGRGSDSARAGRPWMGRGGSGDSSRARGRWMGRSGFGGMAGQSGDSGRRGAGGGFSGMRAAGAPPANGAAGAAGRSSRAQVAFVKTAHGLEPRIVLLGISNYDYAEVLDGVKEGEEVALLSVAELQAKRKQDQSNLRARVGGGMPGVPGGGGAGGGRGTGGGR